MSAVKWSTKTIKNTPVDADQLLIIDSVIPNDQKLITIGTLPAGGFDVFTWASSDEDSPLSTGILYVTEAAAVDKTFSLSTLVLTLKNAPTGSAIEVDILQEDGVNSNSFTTIFSTKPTIDISEFTSQTATTPAVISDGTWNAQRRLQIQLTTNDSNFAATGLKVSI